MKSHCYLNILFVLFFVNCASGNILERKIIPIETYETKISAENCASIISRNFDIAFQEINEEELEKILKNDLFINKSAESGSLRMQKFFICKVILENSGMVPLSIGEIKLQYGSTISTPLKAHDIFNTNKFNSSAINFDEMLSLFKLNSEELCSQNIDFKNNISKYTGHIQPGDKVMQILIFNRIPVSIRKFTLSIAIKSDIIQKIIDFKLIKFEYRKSGKHFIKPKKDDND